MPVLNDIGSFEKAEITNDYLKFIFKPKDKFKYIHATLEISKSARVSFSSFTFFIEDYKNQNILPIAMMISILVGGYGFKVLWMVKLKEMKKEPNIPLKETYSQYKNSIDKFLHKVFLKPLFSEGLFTDGNLSSSIDDTFEIQEDSDIWIDGRKFETENSKDAKLQDAKDKISIDNEPKIHLYIVMDVQKVITFHDLNAFAHAEYKEIPFSVKDFERLYLIDEMAVEEEYDEAISFIDDLINSD